MPLIRGIDLERPGPRRVDICLMALWTIRRTLFFKHGGKRQGLCSICGGPAALVVLKRVDTGIYQGYAAEARRICGSAWSYKPWKRPKCGVEDGERFDVYLRIRCKDCGRVFGEVEDPAVNIQLIHVKIQLPKLK